MRNSIIYLLLVLILSSCSQYGAIMIDAEKPARLHIPKKTRTICFVIRQAMNQEYKDSITSNPIFLNNHKENLRYYDITFEGFFDQIEKTGRFEGIMHYLDEPEVTPDSVEIKPLNWVRAGQICAKTGADILVVLELASYNVSSNPRYSKYTFSWDYTFRVYDPYRFNILETYRIKDNSVMYSDMDNFSINNEIGWNVYNIGREYAKRLISKQEIVERIYYNKGNKLIKLGTYYLKNKEYQKAFDIWKRALKESDNNEDKFKIYVNLALSEELRGDFNKALIYVKSANQYLLKSKHNKKDVGLISERLKDIVKRIKYNKILNQ